MKRFKRISLWNGDETEFDEVDAPDWLTSKKSVKGSTMDMRWFWNDFVLKLEVGQSIDTDFSKIVRIT